MEDASPTLNDDPSVYMFRGVIEGWRGDVTHSGCPACRLEGFHAVMKVSVSGLGRCEVDLQDLQHLYLGHVAVEATLLGLVLGATLSVSLGLFTVALCHYLGVARLMLALSLRGCIPRTLWLHLLAGTP